jgi:hypothetical protein
MSFQTMWISTIVKARLCTIFILKHKVLHGNNRFICSKVSKFLAKLENSNKHLIAEGKNRNHDRNRNHNCNYNRNVIAMAMETAIAIAIAITIAIANELTVLHFATTPKSFFLKKNQKLQMKPNHIMNEMKKFSSEASCTKLHVSFFWVLNFLQMGMAHEYLL